MATNFASGCAAGVLAAGVYLAWVSHPVIVSHVLCVFGGSLVSLVILGLLLAGRE